MRDLLNRAGTSLFLIAIAAVVTVVTALEKEPEE